MNTPSASPIAGVFFAFGNNQKPKVKPGVAQAVTLETTSEESNVQQILGDSSLSLTTNISLFCFLFFSAFSFSRRYLDTTTTTTQIITITITITITILYQQHDCAFVFLVVLLSFISIHWNSHRLL